MKLDEQVPSKHYTLGYKNGYNLAILKLKEIGSIVITEKELNLIISKLISYYNDYPLIDKINDSYLENKPPE